MYMDLDFGPPPELCIYEVSGQDGKMDLDSSPTDSVGLELVLQICFGGHEDALGFFGTVCFWIFLDFGSSFISCFWIFLDVGVSVLLEIKRNSRERGRDCPDVSGQSGQSDLGSGQSIWRIRFKIKRSSRCIWTWTSDPS